MSMDDVARVLLFAPVVNWLAFGILAWVWIQHRDILTLRERTIAAFILALCATGGALLGAWRLDLVELPRDSGLPILAAILVGLNIPGLYWLLLLFTGQLDQP